MEVNSVLRGRRGEWHWGGGCPMERRELPASGTDIETGLTAPEWTRYADGGATMGIGGSRGCPKELGPAHVAHRFEVQPCRGARHL